MENIGKSSFILAHIPVSIYPFSWEKESGYQKIRRQRMKKCIARTINQKKPYILVIANPELSRSLVDHSSILFILFTFSLRLGTPRHASLANPVLA